MVGASRRERSNYSERTVVLRTTCGSALRRAASAPPQLALAFTLSRPGGPARPEVFSKLDISSRKELDRALSYRERRSGTPAGAAAAPE
jgi:hypothetical protein